jgi:hypothetical protein
MTVRCYDAAPPVANKHCCESRAEEKLSNKLVRWIAGANTNAYSKPSMYPLSKSLHGEAVSLGSFATQKRYHLREIFNVTSTRKFRRNHWHNVGIAVGCSKI